MYFLWQQGLILLNKKSIIAIFMQEYIYYNV